MAKFEPKTGGLGSLSDDLKKLGQLTDEDAYTILEPAGEHLAEKLKAKVRGMFQQHTGNLAESIAAQRKQGDTPYIQVAPQGVHNKYNGRKGGVKNAFNSEVAFVLEYGDSRHKATHWMENTINEEADAIGQAMQEGFDKLCDEKGIGL